MTLKEKYPDLLKGCEIAIGNGWIPLVDNLLIAMQEEMAKTGVKFNILQIKEKFGGIRINYGADAPDPDSARLSFDRIRDMIYDAENVSYAICEECGQPGELTRKPSGWWKTLCKAHSHES